MKRKELFNLSAVAAFFLTAALANAQITYSGVFSGKTNNLAQDVMNSMYDEIVLDAPGVVSLMVSQWSNDVQDANFSTTIEGVFGDVNNLGTAVEQQAAIEGFVNDPNFFDVNGVWVAGTTAPNPLTPVVSNVSVAQVAGTKNMEIFYDLAVEDSNPCTVTVLWSTDNGATYNLTATAVTGAAGAGIAPGVGLKITWDMSVDWDNQFTQTGRIKVVASRDPIDRSAANN